MILLQRLRRRFLRRKWFEIYEKSLNRRAEVENYLLRAAAGKEPLPDKETCRQLAAKLGMSPP